MSLPKNIHVKGTNKELEHLIKKSKSLFIPRVKMLLEIKKSHKPLSKVALSERLGVNPNSIQTWRKNYEQGGLERLLSHKKNASRPSVISNAEHQAIETKLKNPNNGLRGYKELQQWIEEEFDKKVKYNTLLKYCVVHFKSKIKVSCKSHINKDGDKVTLLKKTLVTNAVK